MKKKAVAIVIETTAFNNIYFHSLKKKVHYSAKKLL